MQRRRRHSGAGAAKEEPMKKEALNPFLPLDTYIPDGEPHVFGDRVYLFGSHDKENGETFCMLDYEIWSAPVDDLSDWTSRGINYRAEQDPHYGGKMVYMYASDCVRGNDGRYYLYYCLSGPRGQGGYDNPISVAVCDEPDGKYEYLGQVRTADGKPFRERVCFDPGLINDDGTVRLYFGTTLPWLEVIPVRFIRNIAIGRRTARTAREAASGILGSYTAELEDDMLTLRTEPVRIDSSISGEGYREHGFFEASSVRKIDGKYYFIYSTVQNHELCYAVSDRPDGGFVFGGTIISNGDVWYNGRLPEDRLNHTGTNHGSIEKINGKWYVFYHRLTHNSDYSRQACAEQIEILGDGSIPQVEMTSCGLNGGPLKMGTYPAAVCCNLTNGHMQQATNSKEKTDEPCVTSASGERFVSGIADGTLMGWKYFEGAGERQLALQSRSTGSGAFEILAGEKGPVIGKVETGPSEEWSWTEGRFSPESSIFPLYLRYRGEGKADLRQFTIT